RWRSTSAGGGSWSGHKSTSLPAAIRFSPSSGMRRDTNTLGRGLGGGVGGGGRGGVGGGVKRRGEVREESPGTAVPGLPASGADTREGGCYCPARSKRGKQPSRARNARRFSPAGDPCGRRRGDDRFPLESDGRRPRGVARGTGRDRRPVPAAG